MKYFKLEVIVMFVGKILLNIFLTGSFLLMAGQVEQQTGIEGNWQGVLKVSGMELRIVFKISRDSTGAWIGTMDSPDQGARDIPVKEVVVKSDSLILKMPDIGGRFEGKIHIDSLEVEGVWKQSGYTLPLVLKYRDEIPEIKRPQVPKKPYPYIEEEVTYVNPVDSIKLAGTFTYPESGPAFPAVILITGSGAQDRDETILNHRPFLVLADALTRRGIAVLRVDDRGVGGSSGSVTRSTSEDFAGDVLTGVEYLLIRPEVDPEQIGLIGHSEGGIIAPMVAARSPHVAFIVLMAGTGLTGEEILYLQGELIAKANGASDEAIAKNRKMQEGIFAVLKEEKDDSFATEKLGQLFTEGLSGMSEEEKDTMKMSDAQIEAQLKSVLSPWFRFFLTYDPVIALKRVKCPVLAINGEKDLQVPSKENLKAIGEALTAGGNTHFRLKEMPGLNHLFQTSETGSTAEYGKIEETISPEALRVMGDWILEVTGEKMRR